MRQILFPTDFSATADNAFVYALHLARDMKAELVLFHAFTYTTAQALFAPADVLEEVSATRHDEAISQFERYKEMADELDMPLPAVHHVIKAGFAAEIILEVCQELKPYLVVMGTKGSSNLAHDLLGSVTTSVLKAAHFPVLAIPEQARYQGIKKIAYATDFHEKNLRDLYQLNQFGRALHAEVSTVHITDSHADEARIQEIEDHYTRGMEFDTMKLHVMPANSIGQGLRTFAESENLDILAIHPHPRGFWGQLKRRSITQQMALHTQVPILALHR